MFTSSSHNYSKLTQLWATRSVPKVVSAAKREEVKIGDDLITTHHHYDHSGGNEEFKKQFPKARVWGGSEQCKALTNKVLTSPPPPYSPLACAMLNEGPFVVYR
jgi:beta-lactamase superfamily II metal-dependent hydrolase